MPQRDLLGIGDYQALYEKYKKLKISQTFDSITSSAGLRSVRDLLRQLEICGVFLGNGAYLTVAIRPETAEYFPIDGKLDSERELQHQLLCEMVQAYFLGKSIVYATEFGGLVIAVNYFSTETGPLDLEEIFRLSGNEWKKFQKAVWNHYQIKVQLAVSGIYQGVEGLAQSYQESRDLIAYARFSRTDFCQNAYVQTPVRSFLEDTIRLHDLVRQTVFQVFHEPYTRQMAGEITKQLLDDVHNSLQLVKYRCHIFFSMLAVELQRNGLDLVKAQQDGLDFDHLMSFAYEDELEERIDRILAGIFRRYSPLRQKIPEQFSLMAVINYIHENLFDSGMCVTQIADVFHLTQSNLSYHFKRETGESLSDYIARRRLDYALLRLRESDEVVEIIARDAGYGSITTMYRAMKKAVGLTPSLRHGRGNPGGRGPGAHGAAHFRHPNHLDLLADEAGRRRQQLCPQGIF